MSDSVGTTHRLSGEEHIARVRAGKKRNTYQLTMLSVIGVLSFLLLWRFAAMFGWLPSRYVPMPPDIAKLFPVKLTNPNPDGAILDAHILSSLQAALSGFFLAIVIGIPLGLFMGWFRGFDNFMHPIFEILRPIPPVSWIPTIVIWMGLGLKAKAFIVFFSAFVPRIINSYTGIRQTSQALVNVGKVCGASNFTIFREIDIPSTLTMTFAGVHVALGNVWVALVTAEMLAANLGLGYMIQQGRSFARPDIIILGIVVIGILGVILAWILGRVEGKVPGWKK